MAADTKKMKVKTISRAKEDYTRERKLDINKVFRNVDPKLHPFERQREYTRALNATKWDRMFSQPFVYALDGHSDSIPCLATVPTSLTTLISGASDGEIKVWHLGTRRNLWSAMAHEGAVRGVCCDERGQYVLSCGIDRTVKMWNLNPDDADSTAATGWEGKLERKEVKATPVNTYLGKDFFTGIDHHRKLPSFVTCGTEVSLWDESRAEPIHSFTWGADSISLVKFNLVEVNILASCASDRSIALYDVRTRTPIKKLVMKMATNALCWNPMEAYMFSTANEDKNAYTFDMRKLDHAVRIHKDHVSAVMALDYAPTGKEFVTGSYDRSVRIYDVDQGHSREIYHSRRQQRVFSVKWSADNKWILSGSDDFNIRLWRAKASERATLLLPRERNQKNYRDTLKDKFKHLQNIRKISRHRHVPKSIMAARKLTTTIDKAAKVREQNRRKHSKPGAVPFVSVKQAAVVRQVE